MDSEKTVEQTEFLKIQVNEFRCNFVREFSQTFVIGFSLTL